MEKLTKDAYVALIEKIIVEEIEAYFEAISKKEDLRTIQKNTCNVEDFYDAIYLTIKDKYADEVTPIFLLTAYNYITKDNYEDMSKALNRVHKVSLAAYAQK